MIISFWNEDTVWGGYHTVAIDYKGQNSGFDKKYIVYNIHGYATDSVGMQSITQIIGKDTRFIYGFYLPY